MPSVDRNRLVFGADAPQLDMVELRAGPLVVSFEPDTGFLRYCRLGPDEVLRGIYVSVRGADWSTVPPKVSDLHIQRSSSAFRVSFTARNVEGGIAFRWLGRIVGTEDGCITYALEGESLASFETNRTGFCILHPIPECRGRACVLEHVDGTRETTLFPDSIAPYEPFQSLRAMEYSSPHGSGVRIEVAGDAFETEDQRNWTDASFKTFCRPSSLHKPYTLGKGSRVRQSVRILAMNGQDMFLPVMVRPVLGPSGAGPMPLPSLGTVSSPEDIESNSRLKDLGLSHVWSMGALSAHGLDTHLLVPLQSPEVPAWAVVTPPDAAQEGQSLRANPAVGGLAVGCLGNFTELNQNRPGAGLADGVAFAIDPFAHAFDSRSLMETLPIQADCVQTARSFSPGAVHVGPISLGDDPRTWALVGASWTLASYKYLAEAGATSATYFRAEDLFDGDRVSPIYHVLADLAEVRAGEVIPTASVDPARVLSLSVREESRQTTWVANLTSDYFEVEVSGQPGHVRVRRLNAQTVEYASSSPDKFRKDEGEEVAPTSGVLVLTLGAYEVVRIMGA